MALVPLASSAQFNATAYADMASHLQAGDLDTHMLRATRAVETACRRRLATFTGLVETSRLVDGDVEDSLSGALPMPAQAQISSDYARALGYSQLARHAWVREFPPLYPDLWTATVTGVNIYWSYQLAPYVVPASFIQFEPDTGHIRFLLGTFVPPGSTAQITYSGGYSTVPDDLVEGTIVMAASMLLKSLDPGSHGFGHDPDMLRDEAIELISEYMRG